MEAVSSLLRTRAQASSRPMDRYMIAGVAFGSRADKRQRAPARRTCVLEYIEAKAYKVYQVCLL